MSHRASVASPGRPAFAGQLTVVPLLPGTKVQVSADAPTDPVVVTVP
ncbi:MAG TPA: hypothetical protein VGB85_33685 [Nannocystis sp.]